MSDWTRVHLRWILAEIVHVFVSLGYRIRPYDMLADRRRWFWQPRQRCGWSYGIRLDVPADGHPIPEETP